MKHKKLQDGTVLPSTLSLDPPKSARQVLKENYALRMGTVIDIIYPEDKRNVSGRIIEYNVAVIEQNPLSGSTVLVYRNCRVSDLFGMSNNNLTYTLQADDRSQTNPKNGSQVMLLCINGRSDAGQAMIIGGLSHNKGPKFSAQDGQFYDFNFNGINYNINKDGELTITFNSVIDVSGNQTNSAAAGTVLKFDKDGKLKISDNEGQFFELDRTTKKATWSNGAESITVDKANKKIDIHSSGDISESADKGVDISAGDKLSASSKSDMSVNSGSNMQVEAKSNLNMKSGGNWQVNVGGNAMVQAGGVLTMQGGSQAQVKGTITLLGDGSLPAAAVGLSICLGMGNLGGPVISTILTGSSTVFVGT